MCTVGKNNASRSRRGKSKAIGWIFFSPFFSWKTAKPQSLYCGSLSQTPVGRRNSASRREKSLIFGTNEATKLPTSTFFRSAEPSVGRRPSPLGCGGGGKP